MSVITIEATVKQGKIEIDPAIQLPENARVYVIIPDAESEQTARIISPRLIHREQATDFKMELVEECVGLSTLS